MTRGRKLAALALSGATGQKSVGLANRHGAFPLIDLPPIAAPETAIARNLRACGLAERAFTVKYEAALQDIAVVLGRTVMADPALFACIHRAAAAALVSFEDPSTGQAYAKFEEDLYRPQMLAEATGQVERLGLLADFPRRAAYVSVRAYAVALERHCGVASGAALKFDGDDLLFDPVPDRDFSRYEKEYGRLLAAITYAVAIGDLETFGFIGNEAKAEVPAGD